MYSQPMMQYRLATEALDYVCNEGLYGMLKNWDCLVKVMASREVINCENDMIRNNGADCSQFGFFRNLNEYMQCTKYPVISECGDEAWQEFSETAKRQARVFLPFCTLAGFRGVSSTVIVFVSLILAYAWKSLF
ncbi:unnamed protein product [Soboliphyme baturini]|uniref:Poxvirus myristoylprotein n=1 Tax=Soboliphyme baturini TaxID=241478 RepID=A0A183ICD6_9BILA|nr:unnamed protein product [Soboliphyme baturini]